MIDIRELNLSDEQAYRAYFEECQKDDSPYFKNARQTYFSRFPDDFADFLADLKKEQTIPPHENYSTMTIYHAFVGDNIAGQIHCRWQPEKGTLSSTGGYIGYMTAPSYRGQGVMTALLNFALLHYRNRGFRQVLITAEETNTASRQLIEKCGGHLENLIESDGTTFSRYWITL
jgi:predicted acetyltransferase